MANDKKMFYQIIADLDNFEDKLIIEYEPITSRQVNL